MLRAWELNEERRPGTNRAALKYCDNRRSRRTKFDARSVTRPSADRAVRVGFYAAAPMSVDSMGRPISSFPRTVAPPDPSPARRVGAELAQRRRAGHPWSDVAYRRITMA